MTVKPHILRPTATGLSEADVVDATPKQGRAADIPSLTGIRGILAFWVVIYHFWPDVLALFPACQLFSPIIAKGHFAVPAFFLLSGVVLAHNYQHLGVSPTRSVICRFLFKRLARIYPVHCMSLMVVLAMVLVSRNRGWSIDGSGYSSRDFVLNLFLIHTWVPHFSLNWNYPSWSISSEWFAYLFFCPLMILCHRISNRMAGVAIVLSIIGTLAIYYSPKETLFRELVCVVPTFAWGAISVYVWNAMGNSEHVAVVERIVHRLANVPLLLVLASCYVPAPYYTACLLMSLGLLIQSLYLAGARPNCLFDWKPVRNLGEVSYSLYMTHTLAQKILYRLLPSADHAESDLLVKFFILFIYFVVIGAIAVAMYYLIERPAMKLTRPLRSGA